MKEKMIDKFNFVFEHYRGTFLFLFVAIVWTVLPGIAMVIGAANQPGSWIVFTVGFICYGVAYNFYKTDKATYERRKNSKKDRFGMYQD